MEPIKFNDTSDYCHLNVLGVVGVFTESFIDAKTLPEGFYKYSLHGTNKEAFDHISCSMTHNHVGDFICKEPLEFGSTQTKPLALNDWAYESKVFDFKEYFGCHLSIDCQIRNADEKKSMQTGSKDRVKSAPEL